MVRDGAADGMCLSVSILQLTDIVGIMFSIDLGVLSIIFLGLIFSSSSGVMIQNEIKCLIYSFVIDCCGATTECHVSKIKSPQRGSGGRLVVPSPVSLTHNPELVSCVSVCVCVNGWVNESFIKEELISVA